VLKVDYLVVESPIVRLDDVVVHASSAHSFPSRRSLHYSR